MTTEMRALNAPSNALEVQGNDFVLARGVPAIAQAVENELRFILGEWDFDTRRGVDYQRVWENTRDYNLLELTIARHVRSVEGVQQVDDLRVRVDGARVAHISALVTTVAGQFTLDMGV